MPVYVDRARIKYRHMKMSHMIADTREELLAMIDKIGVNRRWIQQKDTYKEHFDICASKRELAIRYGAIPVSPMVLAKILARKREGEL